MKRLTGMLALTAATAALLAGSAYADTSDKRIALSNNYAGNSWRQAMLRSWDKVTKPAVEAGIVAAADPFTTAENQVTEQAAQIQNMVLEGYNAEGGNRKDVWHSADGVTWTEVADTPWKARHAASVFVHDGGLWMVAGNNMEPDAWKLVRK